MSGIPDVRVLVIGPYYTVLTFILVAEETLHAAMDPARVNSSASIPSVGSSARRATHRCVPRILHAKSQRLTDDAASLERINRALILMAMVVPICAWMRRSR
jgi:hypothetical protein